MIKKLTFYYQKNIKLLDNLEKVKFIKEYKMEILKDLWAFMKERKKFWLAPMIIILIILGLIIVLGGSSAIAPFVYTLF